MVVLAEAANVVKAEEEIAGAVIVVKEEAAAVVIAAEEVEIIEAAAVPAVEEDKRKIKTGFQRCYNRSVQNSGNHKRDVLKAWQPAGIQLPLVLSA